PIRAPPVVFDTWVSPVNGLMEVQALSDRAASAATSTLDFIGFPLLAARFLTAICGSTVFRPAAPPRVPTVLAMCPTAVDQEILGRDHFAVVGGEEQGHAGDIDRMALALEGLAGLDQCQLGLAHPFAQLALGH